MSRLTNKSQCKTNFEDKRVAKRCIFDEMMLFIGKKYKKNFSENRFKAHGTHPRVRFDSSILIELNCINFHSVV